MINKILEQFFRALSPIIFNIIPVAAAAAGGGGAAGGGLLAKFGGLLGKGGGGGGGGGLGAGGAQAKRIIGGAVGFAQLISAKRQQKKAEQQKPSLEDPEQRALLEEVQAKRQSIQTGAASATAIREAEQVGATAQANIAKVTGGDVGGTVEALLKAQRGTGKAVNQALAQGQQQQQFFTNLQANLTNRIAQRKLDLQQFERVSTLARAAQLRKEGAGNLGAAFGLSNFGGGQKPPAPATPPIAAQPQQIQTSAPVNPTPVAGNIAPGPQVIGLDPNQSAFGGPLGI